MKNIPALLILLCLALCNFKAISQDDTESGIEVNLSGVKGWHVGFFAGALFASNYSASLYDGYGLDTSGNRNSFVNSVLFQRMITNGLDSINNPLAPNLGIQNPQIDQALLSSGVLSHDQWRFDSTDMPSGLKYSTAFLFGLNLQYGINKMEGLIFNANFAKLNMSGVFTITSLNKQINSSLADSVLFFGVKGQEQRFMLQIGYSRLLGDLSMFNVLVEGGLLMNSVKFLNNYAFINSLQMDLTPFTYNSGYANNYLPSEYNAIGYGAFGGLGVNFNGTKYIIQLLYTPSFERINTGFDPTSKLQNAVGLRVYYTL